MRFRLLLAPCVLIWLLTAALSASAQNDTDRITHLLNRIGYGPRPGDVERVREMGLRQYIEWQLHPQRIDDSDLERRLREFPTLRMSPMQLLLTYRNKGVDKMVDRILQQGTPQQKARLQAMMGDGERGAPRQVLLELGSQKLVRAVHSQRQLQEVMTDFWMNHFNVFWAKGYMSRVVLTSYEQDIIRPRALGKFRDLLLATATSPAMLFYLDNWVSNGGWARPNAKRKAGLNENYARELMELHTLGVDGGYTQKDVVELARCLTGWTIRAPREEEPLTFVFRPRMHDDGPKEFLGTHFPPGQGMQDGLQAIDMLVRHPSTARFICTKLCRRFVSDDPSPALVARAASVFTRTDGDIGQVVRTIITSPEFAASRQDKTKTPLELVASSIRAVGGETNGGRALLGELQKMGMPLYMCQPPTGYADKAQAWVSSGALLERMSFAVALANGKLRGTWVEVPVVGVDRLIDDVLGDACSTQTRQVLRQAEGKNPTLLGLVLGSPEFQRR